MESLDERELLDVDQICRAFRERFTGRENAAKTADLLRCLKAYGVDISGQTLRRLIGHIRNNDLLAPYFVLSNVSTGYWISSQESELSRFLNEQLNRMANQFSNVECLYKRLKKPKNQFSNQLSII